MRRSTNPPAAAPLHPITGRHSSVEKPTAARARCRGAGFTASQAWIPRLHKSIQSVVAAASPR
eukprot:scaffold22093_cov145-Isochrysis_galbana.AAC.5